MTDLTPNREALALAYLTGQASPDEVAVYRRLYATDETFRNLVQDIGVWLAPMKEGVDDIAAPTGLLDSIMSEIDARETARAAMPVPTNDNETAKWKMISAVASLAAVLAIGSHFLGNESPAAPTSTADDGQTLMALLSDDTQPELMAIVYEPSSGRVVARLSNITVPEDGDLQLWLIREGVAAPLSLGVLDRANGVEQIEFDIPAQLQVRTDTLAISLEALGGSSSEGPEGPILYTGAVSALNAGL